MTVKSNTKTFLLFIAIIILMAPLYYVVNQSVSLHKQEKDKLLQFSEIERHMSYIELTLIQARRREKDFLISNDLKYVEMHKEIMGSFYDVLGQLKSKFKSEDGAVLLDHLNKLAKKYESRFQDVVEISKVVGLDENKGLRNDLKNAAELLRQGILNDLKNISGVKDIELSLSKIRNYEKDYIATNNVDYVDALNNEVDSFYSLLATVPKEKARQFIDVVEVYHDDFLLLVDGMQYFKITIDDFSQTVSLIDPLVTNIEVLSQSLRNGQLQSIKTQEQGLNKIYFVSSSALILGMFIIVILFWRTQRMKEVAFIEREHAQTTLRAIGDGVITTDASGIAIEANPVAQELIGKTSDEIVGRPIQDVLTLRNEGDGKDVSNPIMVCLENGRTVALARQAGLVCDDGSVIPIENSAAPIFDGDHQIIGAVMVFRDVTQQRDMLNHIKHQADHDSLTGLINRGGFEERLDKLCLDVAENESEHALCFIDLDKFKIVNDTCGHHAGDELLRQLTKLFHRRIRESDSLARIGGDEFALLLNHCGLVNANKVATDLVEAVNDFKFSWEGHVFSVGVSIGLVSINKDSGSHSEIVKAADAACYTAKNQGRGRVCLHVPDDAQIQARYSEMRWIPRINKALAEDYFELYYQVISNAGDVDRNERHFEVLLRLRDGDELISPAVFMPAAERYHMMMDVDKWVVHNALKRLKSIEYTEGLKVTCSINLSGESVGDMGMLAFIKDEIFKAGVPPQWLCFEVTETVAVANIQRAEEMIDALHEIGCRFSLDDFGSGMSSFNYLKALSVDYLKIDGCFVRNIESDLIDREMVNAINQIGQIMNLHTIAEFVENDEIRMILSDMGVDYVQGYGIAVPAPLTENTLNEWVFVEPLAETG